MKFRSTTCLGFALCGLSMIPILGCTQQRAGGGAAPPGQVVAAGGPLPGARVEPPLGYENGMYRGFDRNDYPGDAAMAAMLGTFAFTGYWLTHPPGETSNSWQGKRALLKQQGWGFLVLANGRLDAEILKAQKHGMSPTSLGQQDAAAAAAAATSEGFPAKTIVFLDQEEGGALLDEQAAYLLGWTEALSGTAFLPGVYASGQPVPEGPG